MCDSRWFSVTSNYVYTTNSVIHSLKYFENSGSEGLLCIGFVILF